MVLDVQQRKLGQHQDLHRHEGCVQELAQKDAHLGTDHSHGERLVKVHMANITPTCGRVCETNLGIQIRSVEINLTTILVDNIARLLDTVLEHAVSRWVCNLGDRMRPGTNARKSDAYHECC